MAIELDLLFIMEQMEKTYSSADERWCSLKEIIREQQAAQQGVQPTVATAALEDSPFETGMRRGAVVLSNRNSG